MYKIYSISAAVLLLLSSVSCVKKTTQAQTQKTKSVVDTISRASFGTPQSRVQFHRQAIKAKLSYNVQGYDDVSGATYYLDSVTLVTDQENIILTNNNSRISVAFIDTNTIQLVLFDNDTNEEPISMIFTPRGEDLGKDPATV
ncbi:MAG: hypothetical protein ACRCTQ_04130 [Brevinemataceae bacterium]